SQRVFRGFLATIGVLLSLVIGTLVAWMLGDANFDQVREADAFGLVVPFQFGVPQFSLGAIISMLVVVIITCVETTGAIFASKFVKPTHSDSSCHSNSAFHNSPWAQ